MTKRIHIPLKEKPSEFKIETEDSDITLPAVIVFSGCRGSGKTYSCIMFMRHFELKKYVTRTFLISPTRHSNDIYSNLKTLKPEDCFSDDKLFQQALQHILVVVTEDWTKYRGMKEYARIYNKWIRTPHRLNIHEEMVIERMGGVPPEKVIKPSHLLVIDDAQGTDMYSHSKKDALTHMIIKHRHIPITIALLAQSWTGIPRTIRLNTTQFAIFKTGDKTQLKQIYDTFANTIPYEEFESLYKEAVAPPHGFLFIDTVPKKEYKRFRSSFNEFLVPQSESGSVPQLKKKSKKS